MITIIRTNYKKKFNYLNRQQNKYFFSTNTNCTEKINIEIKLNRKKNKRKKFKQYFFR